MMNEIHNGLICHGFTVTDLMKSEKRREDEKDLSRDAVIISE